MSVLVVIPFYPGDSEEQARQRTRNLRHVLKLYEDCFPQWNRAIATDYAIPFSKAFANNQLVFDRRALKTVPDVLVFNDADSLCTPKAISDAVEMAHSQPGLVRAFRYYRRLTEYYSEHLKSWENAFTLPYDWSMDGSLSHACIAVRYSCYEEVGGYDPRFRSWGFEDLAADIMFGAFWPTRTVQFGTAVHLNHEAAEGDLRFAKFQAANEQLYYKRYCKLQGDAAALLALRKEAGEWLSQPLRLSV